MFWSVVIKSVLHVFRLPDEATYPRNTTAFLCCRKPMIDGLIASSRVAVGEAVPAILPRRDWRARCAGLWGCRSDVVQKVLRSVTS